MVSRMVGYFAYSIAGRDKEHIYLIIKEETESVWLVYGKIRTLRKPKRKNKKHIQPAGSPLIEKFPVTDDEIYARLKSYIKCKEGVL